MTADLYDFVYEDVEERSAVESSASLASENAELLRRNAVLMRVQRELESKLALAQSQLASLVATARREIDRKNARLMETKKAMDNLLFKRVQVNDAHQAQQLLASLKRDEANDRDLVRLLDNRKEKQEKRGENQFLTAKSGQIVLIGANNGFGHCVEGQQWRPRSKRRRRESNTCDVGVQTDSDHLVRERSRNSRSSSRTSTRSYSTRSDSKVSKEKCTSSSRYSEKDDRSRNREQYSRRSTRRDDLKEEKESKKASRERADSKSSKGRGDSRSSKERVESKASRNSKQSQAKSPKADLTSKSSTNLLVQPKKAVEKELSKAMNSLPKVSSSKSASSKPTPSESALFESSGDSKVSLAKSTRSAKKSPASSSKFSKATASSPKEQKHAKSICSSTSSVVSDSDATSSDLEALLHQKKKLLQALEAEETVSKENSLPQEEKVLNEVGGLRKEIGLNPPSDLAITSVVTTAASTVPTWNTSPTVSINNTTTSGVDEASQLFSRFNSSDGIANILRTQLLPSAWVSPTSGMIRTPTPPQQRSSRQQSNGKDESSAPNPQSPLVTGSQVGLESAKSGCSKTLFTSPSKPSSSTTSSMAFISPLKKRKCMYETLGLDLSDDSESGCSPIKNDKKKRPFKALQAVTVSSATVVASNNEDNSLKEPVSEKIENKPSRQKRRRRVLGVSNASHVDVQCNFGAPSLSK